MRAVILAVVVLLAVQTHVTAADPKPESEAYYNRGLDWLKKMDCDKALAEFNEAVRLDPSNAKFYNDRGYAWMRKKDCDKALTDYNEAIRLNPKLGMAYYNRAAVWRIKKDYDKAIADHKEAIRLDPRIRFFCLRLQRPWICLAHEEGLRQSHC